MDSCSEEEESRAWEPREFAFSPPVGLRSASFPLPLPLDRYKGAKQAIAEGCPLFISDPDERFELRRVQGRLRALCVIYR